MVESPWERAWTSGRRGKLFFVCGKMAAGKSTLSKELAAREDAVLLGQDELLVTLFPEEIVDLAAFVKCSTRIQEALAPHICSLLSKGRVSRPRLSRQYKKATRVVPSAA